LQLISVSAQQGTTSINGNTATFNVGTVKPGKVIKLTVITKVSTAAKPPMDAVNTAMLNNGKTASVTIRVVTSKLPSTGEHPDEGLSSTAKAIIALIAALILLGIIGSGYIVVRRRV